MIPQYLKCISSTFLFTYICKVFAYMLIIGATYYDSCVTTEMHRNGYFLQNRSVMVNSKVYHAVLISHKIGANAKSNVEYS